MAERLSDEEMMKMSPDELMAHGRRLGKGPGDTVFGAGREILARMAEGNVTLEQLQEEFDPVKVEATFWVVVAFIRTGAMKAHTKNGHVQFSAAAKVLLEKHKP